MRTSLVLTMLLVAITMAQTSANRPQLNPASLVEVRSGFPLSLQQIEDSTRKLTDGSEKREILDSRISRDSAGRVRVESRQEGSAGDSAYVCIFDPVEGSITTLDAPTRTAHRWRVPNPVTPSPGVPSAGDKEPRIAVLGQRSIEGINFLGTRVTAPYAGTFSTTVISERWISIEMGLTALVETSGPEGKYSARFKDLELREPDPRIFTVPAGYTLQEMPLLRSGQR
jgi:hypothetical protein